MPSTRAICANSSRRGKKIIISTVQKFPFILDEIGDEHRGKKFAHRDRRGALQPGRETSAAMSHALGAGGDETDPEDTVNDAWKSAWQARKMLTNASYFAFTATPKNKTLEMFGDAVPPDAGGQDQAPRPSTATR